MTLTLIFLALIIVLFALIHEEKLIAFEDKVWGYVADRLGWLAAQVYLKLKKKR